MWLLDLRGSYPLNPNDYLHLTISIAISCSDSLNLFFNLSFLYNCQESHSQQDCNLELCIRNLVSPNKKGISWLCIYMDSHRITCNISCPSIFHSQCEKAILPCIRRVGAYGISLVLNDLVHRIWHLSLARF